MKDIQYRDGYLFIEYDESTEQSVLIELMKEIAQICEAKGYKKILVDLRKTTGTVEVLTRYQLGVAGADLLRGISQLAIVYHKDENNYFAESVAVNRGLPSKITDDMDEAKSWLGVE